ncbi:MAG: amidohydrolase family protein [Gammaproteobacteria bacterium]|nr:amidohydrolase family protein [Gammaproteobacteria bacterium]MDE0365729.1 amidohydrolase family protein [Gammaproteobacteria bacterium]
MTDFDIRISGGTIVDGTGAPGQTGDVGIVDGRIAALGKVKGSAKVIIDAQGQVVCPGFVDIHTHYDAQVLWDRMLSVSPWHGVTTAVMGNCGFGLAPTRPEHRELILRTLQKVEGMDLQALEAGVGSDWPFVSFGDYLSAVERQGVAVNVAAYVGHTPVRLFVMGEDAAERRATGEEIEAMCDIVKDAVDAGALGFASSKAGAHVGFGGKPVPSRLAEPEEFAALGEALGRTERGVLQMTVGPGDFLAELRELAEISGRTLTWTALLAGLWGPGSHREYLARTAALQRQGINVVPQVSCRPLRFEFDLEEPFPLESLPIVAALNSLDRAGRKARYAQTEFRTQFREAVADLDAERGTSFWERTDLTFVPQAPELLGVSVAEAARQRKRDPADLFLELAVDSDLAMRASWALMNDDEDEVEELLRDPHTVLALSDAGAHANQLCDACFSTHLLGHWVRERGALSLPEAVRMLTSRPAEVVGITDRGLLAEGRPADVVVFDPDTVGPSSLQRVNDLPAGADRLIAEARGIKAVIVNGKLIRDQGGDLLGSAEALPGRVLRNGAATASIEQEVHQE